jgi:hypothetical protein
MKKTRLVLLGLALIYLSCRGFDNKYNYPLKDNFAQVNRPIQIVEQGSGPKSGDVFAGFISGNIKGDTTYRIDFPEGASQLAFPLDTSILGFELCLTRRDSQNNSYEKGRFTLKWMVEADNTASGKMEDSDWLYDALDLVITGQTNPGLDIFSKSKADISAQMIDLNYNIPVASGDNVIIGVFAGYAHQKFNYSIYDVNQVGYGPYASNYSLSVSGKVLDYEVKYSFPYFGVSTDVFFDQSIKFSVQYGYSDFVDAQDIDDHILRYKMSEGKATGHANLFSLKFEWSLDPQWILQLSENYTKIYTTGKQNQSWYGNDPASAGDDTGGYINNIDDKITSNQKIISFGMIYKF